MIDRKIVECNAQIQELKAKIVETRAKSKDLKSKARDPTPNRANVPSNHYQTMFLSQQPEPPAQAQETVVMKSEDFGLSVNVAKPNRKFFSPMFMEPLSPEQNKKSPQCNLKPGNEQKSNIARPKLAYDFAGMKNENNPTCMISELDNDQKSKLGYDFGAPQGGGDSKLMQSENCKEAWVCNSRPEGPEGKSGFIDDYLGKMKSKIDSFQNEFEKYQKKMKNSPAESDKVDLPKAKAKKREPILESPLKKTLTGKDGKFSFANVAVESPDIDLEKLINLEATMSKFVQPEIPFDVKNCLHYFITPDSDQMVNFGTLELNAKILPARPQQFVDPMQGQFVMFKTGCDLNL
jgi:hypothetical protein